MQGSMLSVLLLVAVVHRGCLAQNSSSAVLPAASPPTTLASFPSQTSLRPDVVSSPPATTVAPAQPSPDTTVADDSCSTDAQCTMRKGDLYICVGAACVCGPKAYEKAGTCAAKKYLNEPCITSEECQHIDHAVCTSSVCSCDVGYTSSDNVCNLAIPSPSSAAVPINRDISGITIKPNYDAEGNYKLLKLTAPELVLECTVTGASVNYTVTWLKNKTALPKDERFKTVQPNKLTIKQLEESDADTYTCVFTFSNNATPSRQEDIAVVVPVYVRLPASTNAVEGDTMLLKCNVIGHPMPNVEWQIGNTTLREDKGRFQLLEFEGVPNAMLQVEDMKMEDRGEYKCLARNPYWNETSATTMVRVKDKLAALWPFLGICAEVFVLCAIILIYEKKRNKTELEESDTDQSPEQKNTPDHGKDSVRQRK